jgi:DNA-binding transcriptional ArsR family regulator
MNHKLNFQSQKTFPRNSKQKSALISQSNWWTPLWRGLAVEPSAKHFKAMGSAVWLYLYLLVFANRATGNLFRRISTIAGDMGMSSRTVSRWLSRLKDAHYIKIHQTGRSLQISITKWKPIKKR